MNVSAHKIAQAYKSSAFNNSTSSNTPRNLPRGVSPINEAFPKEKSFGELLKRELQRTYGK